MKQVRIVLVGMGGYGGSYLRQMLRDMPSPRFTLTAIVDPVAQKSADYAQVVERKIPVFASMQDFAAVSEADLCIIAAPIGFHQSYTHEAMELGMDVLCEKPAAGTLQEIRAMMADAEKYNKLLAIGYQWCYAPNTQAIRRDILAGRFGAPVDLKMLTLWQRDHAYFARSSWAGKIRDSFGHVVLDSIANNATAHYLYNMLYLTNAEVQSIEAECYRANKIENFDTCAVHVNTVQGFTARYYASHAVRVEVGPAAVYRFENATIYADSSFQYTCVTDTGEIIPYHDDGQHFAAKFYDAVDMVTTRQTPKCRAQDTLSHATVINLMGQYVPIYDFDKALVRETETLTDVPYLQDDLTLCYAQGRLPSEIGCRFAKPATKAEAAGFVGYQK